VKNKDWQNKAGGVLHTDLTRAESRIAHAMMLVTDPDELRALNSAFIQIQGVIARMFGDAPRPKVGT